MLKQILHYLFPVMAMARPMFSSPSTRATSIDGDLSTPDYSTCQYPYEAIAERFAIVSNVDGFPCNATAKIMVFGDIHSKPNSLQEIGKALEIFCNFPETYILTEGPPAGQIYDCSQQKTIPFFQTTQATCKSWEDPLAFSRTHEYLTMEYAGQVLEDLKFFLLDLDQRLEKINSKLSTNKLVVSKSLRDVFSGPMSPYPDSPKKYMKQYKAAIRHYYGVYIDPQSTQGQIINAAEQVFLAKQSELEHNKRLNPMIDGYSVAYEATQEAIASVKSSSDVLTPYFNWFDETVEKLNPLFEEANLAYGEYTIRLRNRGMKKTIEASLTEGAQVCVVTGVQHFAKNSSDFFKNSHSLPTTFDGAPQDEIIRFFSQHSHAIMQPVSNENDDEYGKDLTNRMNAN